jgi:hypothetical protein
MSEEGYKVNFSYNPSGYINLSIAKTVKVEDKKYSTATVKTIFNNFPKATDIPLDVFNAKKLDSTTVEQEPSKEDCYFYAFKVIFEHTERLVESHPP